MTAQYDAAASATIKPVAKGPGRTVAGGLAEAQWTSAIASFFLPLSANAAAIAF
jgi:hypothetical protein